MADILGVFSYSSRYLLIKVVLILVPSCWLDGLALLFADDSVRNARAADSEFHQQIS